MNNKLTPSERRHLQKVKALPCGVCGAAGPSDAHHIEQHKQYLCIPLCKDCHQGSFNGIHGQKRLQRPYLDSSPGLLQHLQQPHTNRQHVVPHTHRMMAIDIRMIVDSADTACVRVCVACGEGRARGRSRG